MLSQKKLKLKLKSLRSLNGDSLEKLSDELGITIGTLCRKENGKANFTLLEAKYIANKYKKTIEEIFFD